jgi:hypothetical protein
MSSWFPIRPRSADQRPGAAVCTVCTVCTLLVLALGGIAPRSASPSPWDGLAYRGEVQVRWLQVDVDGRPPGGLYGEPLAQQTALQRRLLFELRAEIDRRLHAGGLLRLSNEPERVLVLGPDYYARPEGSAFIELTLAALRARAGYYTVHWTPLTLMRWDEADIALGGTQRGCACGGGAAAGVLVESLESIQPDLTLEGLRADGALGHGLDWTVLYARPIEAHIETVPELGILDTESFRYHRDLYAARLVGSRLHHPTLGFRRVGLTVLHVRDDPAHPDCPAPTLAVCEALAHTAAGVDTRLPVGRHLLLEGEWLRTATRADTRGEAPDADWATAYRLTGLVRLAPLTLASAWIHLGADFAAPFGAVTYAANRRGHRHRLTVAHRGIELTVFGRWREPVEREWVDASAQAALGTERIGSVEIGAELGAGWRARAGYQHDHQEVERRAGAPLTQRDGRRDVTTLELVHERDGLRLELDQQWLWEAPAGAAGGSGTATVATMRLVATF